MFSQQAGRQETSIDKFTANLTGGGMAWAEGAVLQIDPAALCCSGQLPYGLYFNKKTPYVAVEVPSIRPSIPGPPSGPEESQIKAAIPVFQLDPDEAVVVIGVTPPEAKFFNYQLYLIERLYPSAAELLPGSRKFVFASLGDAVNLRTINTIGPTPFNRPVVFLYTPDKGTEARVRAALRSAGYPDAIINLVPFPAPMVNLGLNIWTNDVFAIVHRMAMFTDPDGAGKDYYDAFTTKPPKDRPLRAFRVSPKNMGALRPFSTPPLRIRGTSQTEMDLTSSLTSLRQGILDHYKAEGYKAKEYETRPIAYDGFDFVQRGANALADTRDALYVAAGWMPEFDLGKVPEDVLTLADDEFLIAYGPKHVATGKATYSNINVYASVPQLPLGSVFFDKFEGSAAQYGGSEMMYAYKIKHFCDDGDQYCMPLDPPPDNSCKPWCAKPKEECPYFNFDKDSPISILWRNYLEPRTKIGAPFTEVLYDRVIKFSPR